MFSTNAFARKKGGTKEVTYFEFDVLNKFNSSILL